VLECRQIHPPTFTSHKTERIQVFTGLFWHNVLVNTVLCYIHIWTRTHCEVEPASEKKGVIDFEHIVK